MGRLSYEMYLSHMFVVLSVASFVQAAQWNPYWGFVWYPPAILMAWGLGLLIERYFSVPSMKWLLGERKAITFSHVPPSRAPTIATEAIVQRAADGATHGDGNQ